MSHSKTAKRTKPARGKDRSNPRAKPAKAKQAVAGATRAGTKQEAVLTLLRGFLAAVVRKKLALALVSDKTDGDRHYRIAAAKPSKAKPKPQAGDRPATQPGAATT